MVRILGFHCRGLGSIPGQGSEILQAAWYGKEGRKGGSEEGRKGKQESSNIYNIFNIKFHNSARIT